MTARRVEMKCALAALGAALTALSLGLSTAAADVGAGGRKCERDATWQVSVNPSGASYADVAYTTSPNALCRRINAIIMDDGNFSVSSTDVNDSYSARFDLLGAAITGSNAFAGTASFTNGTLTMTGPVVIASDKLTAQLTGWVASGGAVVALAEEYIPMGGCGLNCYRTHMVTTFGGVGT
jgi:hypothetical protein